MRGDKTLNKEILIKEQNLKGIRCLQQLAFWSYATETEKRDCSIIIAKLRLIYENLRLRT